VSHAMTITPRELLDTSIAQLQMLIAFLSEQLGETGGGAQPQSDASEVRACREVLLSLSALIPKVQVAGGVELSARVGVGEPRGKVSSFARYASAQPAPATRPSPRRRVTSR
jgi:hypothetical protein